ncbi:MAG TPA: class I SAM-dependent methyltransferase [Bryobacteraceae bacterium]|nr:class I SAM-dependent methyltransferase [Bryobacteraceae bacterium]
MANPEFDRYSSSYEELLRDPIRDRFTAGESGFFHRRKRDLIRKYCATKGAHARTYLDLGCGKGELLTLLRDDFVEAAGVDPSETMMQGINGILTRVQNDPAKIPFEDERFDFVSAVCVYHHVPPAERLALTLEVKRVLKPNGIFCIIEHNPWNPATRLIVSRTPVDENAILLRASETRRLLKAAGFQVRRQEYFLYLPESLYRRIGALENLLSWLPFGGQYATFGHVQ